MLWQDWVISIAQVVLDLALIPTIRSRDKPPLSTTISFAFCVGTIGIMFITLGLWFSALTALFGSAGWVIVSYQKYRQKK